jgi:Tol biopolymer transport system component
MTEHSDISRVLRHWFDDGPSTMPDRVVDVVADRIGRQPQRPTRRLPRTRRPASVNARIAAAVAAIVIGGLGLGVLAQLSRESIASQPPGTTGPPSLLPTASPSAAATEPPLSGTGLVVFEHDWPLGAAPHTRLEYLLPDLRGEVLLPGFEYEQFGPTWNRDGSRLAFSGWDPREEDRRQLIWETDANGSQPSAISSSCDPPACLEEKDPGYSPDGSSIVFVRSSGEPGSPPVSTVLAIRDLQSGAVTELEETRRPYVGEDGRITSLRHPRWSPDGSTLVFHVVVSDADDTATDTDLFVVGVDGSALRPLTPEDLLAADGEWSPDGSTILFSSKSVFE